MKISPLICCLFTSSIALGLNINFNDPAGTNINQMGFNHGGYFTDGLGNLDWNNNSPSLNNFRTLDFPTLNEGIYLFENVINSYDLSNNLPVNVAEKGFRFVLKNNDRQGIVNNLYTTNDGSIEVFTTGWYEYEGVVNLINSNRSNLNNFTQKSTEDLTIQTYINLDTGEWLSRYRSGSLAWINLANGSGFETIGQIQITSRNPSGSWVSSGPEYDYVKIDSISLEQVNAIPEPSTYALILGAVALGFAFRRRK